MRDRETIDSELRRIALKHRSIREQGGQPSSRQLDELLDERLGHRTAVSDEALEDFEAQLAAVGTPSAGKPFRPKRVLRRFGLLAALPLSLIAVAAVFVVTFAAGKPSPAAQSAEVPPSSSEPSPAPPPSPAAPIAHTPPGDIVDRAFVETLEREGVPIPSQEYVMTHGHAVCDFLTRQPNLAAAARFMQGSTVWDANQSTDVTAGAVVSYCPQYETASAGAMEPGYQNALSDLQSIQRDLQGIQGGLQGIHDDLPGLQGHE